MVAVPYCVMRVSTLIPLAIVILSAAAQGSSASTLSQLPQCARTCFAGALPKSSCSSTNQTCLCESERFNFEMNQCVSKDCTVDESLSTMNITQTSCGAPVRNKSNMYKSITSTFSIISGIFVIQRFGYKIYTRLDICLDDWFVLLALIVGTPAAVMNSHAVIDNGLGRDIWTLSPEQITNFGRFFYIEEIIYIADVSILKLSFLFFYMRIFPGTTIRWLLLGTVAVNCLSGVVFTFVAIFQCTPISYFWEQWEQKHVGACININAFGWSNAAFSIGLDLWMLALPLWQIKGLQLGWKKKLGVAVMFSMGTFVTVVSILRLKSLVAFRSGTPNPTWDFLEVGVWSHVEINVGVICVCLPSLRLLLVRLFPNILGTTGQRDTRSYIDVDYTRGHLKTHERYAKAAARGEEHDDVGRFHGNQEVHLRSVKGADEDAFQLVVIRSSESNAHDK